MTHSLLVAVVLLTACAVSLAQVSVLENGAVCSQGETGYERFMHHQNDPSQDTCSRKFFRMGFTHDSASPVSGRPTLMTDRCARVQLGADQQEMDLLEGLSVGAYSASESSKADPVASIAIDSSTNFVPDPAGDFTVTIQFQAPVQLVFRILIEWDGTNGPADTFTIHGSNAKTGDNDLLVDVTTPPSIGNIHDLSVCGEQITSMELSVINTGPIEYGIRRVTVLGQRALSNFVYNGAISSWSVPVVEGLGGQSMLRGKVAVSSGGDEGSSMMVNADTTATEYGIRYISTGIVDIYPRIPYTSSPTVHLQPVGSSGIECVSSGRHHFDRLRVTCTKSGQPVQAAFDFVLVGGINGGSCGDGQFPNVTAQPDCQRNPESYEQCDDGNNLNGDGCDEFCRGETAPSLSNFSPSTCSLSLSNLTVAGSNFDESAICLWGSVDLPTPSTAVYRLSDAHIICTIPAGVAGTVELRVGLEKNIPGEYIVSNMMTVEVIDAGSAHAWKNLTDCSGPNHWWDFGPTLLSEPSFSTDWVQDDSQMSGTGTWEVTTEGYLRGTDNDVDPHGHGYAYRTSNVHGSGSLMYTIDVRCGGRGMFLTARWITWTEYIGFHLNCEDEAVELVKNTGSGPTLIKAAPANVFINNRWVHIGVYAWQGGHYSLAIDGVVVMAELDSDVSEISDNHFVIMSAGVTADRSSYFAEPKIYNIDMLSGYRNLKSPADVGTVGIYAGPLTPGLTADDDHAVYIPSGDTITLGGETGIFPSTDWTLGFWFQMPDLRIPDAAENDMFLIFGDSHCGDPARFAVVVMQNKTANTYTLGTTFTDSGGDSYLLQPKRTLHAGEWYFYTFTFSPEKTIELFIDGTLEASAQVPDSTARKTTNSGGPGWVVGVREAPCETSLYKDMLIDEVISYTSVIDRAQIMSLFRARAGSGYRRYHSSFLINVANIGEWKFRPSSETRSAVGVYNILVTNQVRSKYCHDEDCSATTIIPTVLTSTVTAGHDIVRPSDGTIFLYGLTFDRDIEFVCVAGDCTTDSVHNTGSYTSWASQAWTQVDAEWRSVFFRHTLSNELVARPCSNAECTAVDSEVSISTNCEKVYALSVGTYEKQNLQPLTLCMQAGKFLISHCVTANCSLWDSVEYTFPNATFTSSDLVVACEVMPRSGLAYCGFSQESQVDGLTLMFCQDLACTKQVWRTLKELPCPLISCTETTTPCL